jgi:hypothetical protein
LDWTERERRSLIFWEESRPTFETFFEFIFHLSLESNAAFTEFMDDHTAEKLRELYDKYHDCKESILNIDLLVEERLLLQGLRCTVGTSIQSPPPWEILISAFERPWHPKDSLTIGARALSKHIHRSKNGWYGVLESEYTGTTAQKNLVAKKLLDKLIENSIWFNVHSLPHSVVVFEIRVQQGFGCRWAVEGEFRGFLEPMMKDGHQNRWRHD